MEVFLIICALLATGLAGYFMVKGFKPAIVLLFAGLFLITISTILIPELSLLDEKSTTGSKWFDIFEMFESVAKSQLTGVGLIIMSAGGFSTYMNKIGASRSLVEAVSKPISRLQNPYILLVLSYFIGQALFMVIPSAAGLALLLLVLLLPILRAANVTAASAGAIIASVSALPMGPATGTTVLASETVGQSPVVYFVTNQLVVAIPTMIAIAITHFFVQRFFDRREAQSNSDYQSEVDSDQPEAPGWYAVLLTLPIVLLVIFSPLVSNKIELSTVTAFFLVWLLAVIIELIRSGDRKKTLNDAHAFFGGMGKMFTSVVSLIIAAQIFAKGLQSTGLINALISGAQHLGLGIGAMAIIFTLIVGFVTFLTGSGVGPFSAFAKLAPEIAEGVGGQATAIVTPMQFASGLFRSMSPISGVVIAVAGGTNITPLSLVKRTAIPMIIGVIVMTTCSLIFL
ncbi:C4-dicarboxylate transporter DcuC [Corynebacterium glucuronolyticum]|uniref:C4-dicarboxylate transporter DcuC n=3 Tax=Corynebacterium glucuronolyticum TaxID=39791 RepID=A0AAX1L9Q7_9CORY|nr:C4-dicarboxylate transporter DcuC [Corynebacterium glucuronolyticum]EEI27814.1 transporter, anaerobic C4-dicarboxylate uptake C (DcuC) family [Corynebacterium glucuronolyticum ATCC 51867]EEI63936.1 transporter, anaerobic C4-dicarboxylate uptake C (DcuC) family [Corynebacterium glucuronolyticum ATCC 51866]QRO82069.1 C4-dicarboxylate transporter DcuC [Corynebacterium glucuronolyticum]QRP70737.1 C4-dicarboxylate transporter DcuC [Corynebacterium glucuronolyticum]